MQATQFPLRQRSLAYYNSPNMEPITPPKEENRASASESSTETKKESLLDFIKFGVIAVIIVIPIRLYVAQPFIVSGASMIPSFQSGNYLIIDEISYRFEEPKRGEVVVFRLPQQPSKFLIKRIAGLPGETILMDGKDVHIKNEEYPEGFVWKQGALNSGGGSDNFEVTLGPEEYFVLGDNRGESADSRLWGKLNREFIVGRPFLRLFPVSEFGTFPGEWE